MGLGKYIFGGLGWAFAGPIGAIAMYLLGEVFETIGENSKKGHSQSGDFAVSLLILSASVMKADGKVLKSELDTVKKFLLTQFGEEKAKKLLQSLKKILELDYNLAEVCQQIRVSMNLAERRVLLHFLYDIANADGHISSEEQNRILFIGLNLQIPRADINSIYASYGYKSYNNTYKRTASIDHYTVLEISKSASDDEVKKAYRSMVKKFHPDKVSNLGEVAVKEAEKRIKQINEAYEAIKKERGIK